MWQYDNLGESKSPEEMLVVLWIPPKYTAIINWTIHDRPERILNRRPQRERSSNAPPARSAPLAWIKQSLAMSHFSNINHWVHVEVSLLQWVFTYCETTKRTEGTKRSSVCCLCYTRHAPPSCVAIATTMAGCMQWDSSVCCQNDTFRVQSFRDLSSFQSCPP